MPVLSLGWGFAFWPLCLIYQLFKKKKNYYVSPSFKQQFVIDSNKSCSIRTCRYNISFSGGVFISGFTEMWKFCDFDADCYKLISYVSLSIMFDKNNASKKFSFEFVDVIVGWVFCACCFVFLALYPWPLVF